MMGISFGVVRTVLCLSFVYVYGEHSRWWTCIFLLSIMFAYIHLVLHCRIEAKSMLGLFHCIHIGIIERRTKKE